MTDPTDGVGQASGFAVRLNQRTHLPRLVPFRRRWVDDALDQLRLRLDTFPNGVYQPVDELPVRKAKRAEGSRTRWAAMRPLVERLDVGTALDVGANAGYFSLKLAELGAMVIAIEPDPGAFRTASLAVSRSRQRSRVGTMRMEVRPDTIELLPSVDAVVVLSLWHHLVHQHGLAVASDLLRGLWERTAKVLFFDTGEREMPASYGLPDFEPSAREWLSTYLAATCEGSRVEHLGVHGAFDADGRPAQRNLFAVVRSSDVADRFRA